MTLRNKPSRQKKQRPGDEKAGHSLRSQADAGALLPRWVSTALTILALAAVVYVLTFRPVTDPDTWFHLKLGQWIEETGKLPRTDPFSHTAGDTPYVPSGWLTAVLMNNLDKAYPDSSLGPILMVTTVIALTSLVILARAWRSGTIIATALLLMAGLCMAVVRFSPRPDVWSLLGLTLLLWLLTADWLRRERGRRRRKDEPTVPAPDVWLLWVVPLFIIAWANLHAGVIIAIPFLLTYGLWLVIRWLQTKDDAWAYAALPVAVACVAWQLNPYGPGLADLAWRISHIPDVSWVMEWMPFFKAGFPMAWPAYIMGLFVIGIAIWAVLKMFRAVHPLEILWLVFLIGLALMQRRQLGLVAVGVPLLLARHLMPMEVWLRSAWWRSTVIPIGLAVIIAGLQVSGENGNAGGRPYYGRNCSVLPCITAEFLKQNPPPQPIFNSYNLGGYLLHELYPTTKVFIDGRLDVYPHQVWLDMLAVEEDRLPIDELVSRYNLETFVIGIADSFGDPMHLASRLAAREDFTLVHLDDVAAVFVKRTRNNIDYLTRFGLPSLSPWNLPEMARTVITPASQQQMINDVGRLLMQSDRSATASALAGYIAWIAGDTETMTEQLTWARQRQPNNGLLRLVEIRMQTAQEAVAEEE